MGTIWRELRGSAGFPDPGGVSGEPVHQRATGILHTKEEQSASALGTLGIKFHSRYHTLMSHSQTYSNCKFKSECEIKF